MEKLIQKISDNEVMFSIDCEFISDKDVEYILANGPDAFRAKREGVTLSQYLTWRECEGSIQCSAKTTRGKRCKRIVHARLDPKEWVEIEWDYCPLHGGERAEAHQNSYPSQKHRL
jgi:hypothetical protein